MINQYSDVCYLFEVDSSDEEAPLVMTSSTLSRESEETAILQASVFIEDGIHYRSIHHKIDPR